MTNVKPDEEPIPESFLFGYGSCKPKCLQTLLNNPKAILLFLTLANIIQGTTINGLLKVNVTSIERRFNLLSSESGLIISAYDIAGCLMLLPVSYLGGRGHKPRWIGVGLIFTSFGMLMLALPHFLAGTYVYSTASSIGFDSNSSSSCITTTSGEPFSNKSEEELCAESHEERDADAPFSLSNMKYVFMFGQFMVGVGSTPFSALSLTFLDDSVDPAHYPVYIGIYYLGALIGPAAGFIIGGKLLTVFTELGVTPDDITVHSPQWVGAWWVGFLICSLAMFLIAIPILGYPKYLKSTLTRQNTLLDFKEVKGCGKSDQLHLLPMSQSMVNGTSRTDDLPAASSTKDNKLAFISDESLYAIAVEQAQNSEDESNRSIMRSGQPTSTQTELPLTHSDKVINEIEPKLTNSQQNKPVSSEHFDGTHPSPSIGVTGPVSINCEEVVPSPKKTTFLIVKHFFSDLLKILTHKAFIALSLAAAVLGTIVSGFSTFGPKFVESQFGRSASDAANVFGFIFLPASAFGLLLGSFMMSGLKLRHKKALLTCFVVSVFGLLAQLIIALSCPDLKFAGVTVPYTGQSKIEYSPPRSFKYQCNADCECPNNAFDPVCANDGITYFSPCFAGCHIRPRDSETIYFNCSCVTSTSVTTNSGMALPTNNSTAKVGRCSIECVWQTLILISLFFVVATTFMCAIPGTDLSLRCFPKEMRSLSVGVQWILIRTLGTIPGPIIFGSMIDSTCLLWHKVDPCARGLGSCVMYMNRELSFSMLLLSMIFKGASVICFGIAWLKYAPAVLMNSITVAGNTETKRSPEIQKSPEMKRSSAIQPGL